MSIIIHSSLQGGRSSLMLACEYSCKDVVKILLSAGVQANLQDKVKNSASPAQ